MTDATAHSPHPELIFSPLLQRAGIPHAFTTRRGGTSTGIFSSLNFGNPSELSGEQRDPRERIERHWAAVLRAIDRPRAELVEVHQVHGAEALLVRPGQPTHGTLPPGTSTKADAIVTDDPVRAVAVRVADCAPVLLASSDGKVVAAVHSGWRGVISGIVAAAASRMRELGAAPHLAAIGPCIGPEAFEVGPEVAEQFHAAFPRPPRPVVRPAPAPGKHLVDLPACLELQLRDLGVEHVDTIHACTYTDADRFFSHRRDKGLTGRMAAIIAPR